MRSVSMPMGAMLLSLAELKFELVNIATAHLSRLEIFNNTDTVSLYQRSPHTNVTNKNILDIYLSLQCTLVCILHLWFIIVNRESSRGESDRKRG